MGKVRAAARGECGLGFARCTPGVFAYGSSEVQELIERADRGAFMYHLVYGKPRALRHACTA